jgi:uncharacterized protein YyaL (SSP411 family)
MTRPLRTGSRVFRGVFAVCPLVLGSFGCATTAAVAPARPAPSVSPPASVSKADAVQNDTRGAPGAPLPWAAFDAATFAKARAEHKFVVLDGAAEWCHWCHVMEATTYHDAGVRSLLDAKFIAAKVDVDARPDIEERYAEYGWPATVIFSPEGEELGKYRGYIAPDAFAEILRAVVDAKSEVKESASDAATTRAIASGKGPLPEDEIAWIARSTELGLADLYDDDAGGWGRMQKAAIAGDNAWALSRARAGDEAMKTRALFTLDAQRRLLDPVWGGIYQYSAAGDWEHPHFEKLMTFQAGALDNYADAYALTHDAKWLTCAKAMRGYVDHFLTSPEGGFYATQDADLGAHAEPGSGAKFLTGHEYYPLDDAHRRALGVPRVDAHEYGKENGLAIAAYVTLAQAANDPTALATATRAAKRILATHGTARGGIAHDADPKASALHLSDNAPFGLALMRLYEATGAREWLDDATKIADFMLRDLADTKDGGFFGSTVDPDAVGVFAARRKPFEDNVTAVRFLARVAKATKDAKYETAIGSALRAIATPDGIAARGRMIGDFLEALDETRGVRGAVPVASR